MSTFLYNENWNSRAAQIKIIKLDSGDKTRASITRKLNNLHFPSKLYFCLHYQAPLCNTTQYHQGQFNEMYRGPTFIFIGRKLCSSMGDRNMFNKCSKFHKTEKKQLNSKDTSMARRDRKGEQVKIQGHLDNVQCFCQVILCTTLIIYCNQDYRNIDKWYILIA